MRNSLALSFVLGAAWINAFANETWHPKERKDGIKIEFKNNEGEKYEEFLAETIIEAPVKEVFNIISDTTLCARWVHRCLESEVVYQRSLNEKLIYQITKFPFPSKSREVYLHTEISFEEKGSIVISMNSRKFKPKRTNLIQINEARIRYVLKPTKDRKTLITWQQYFDPGGRLPLWIINREGITFLQKSLGNLKNLAETPSNN